jgi:chromate transporter
MIAIAYGFQAISSQSGFLHGLKLAAVAVVAQAVWTMAVKLCTDRERVTFALMVDRGIILQSTDYARDSGPGLELVRDQVNTVSDFHAF